MKTKSKKHNWIVDVILFVGLVLEFFLDLTGLGWHQWLGVILAVLTGYHLLIHWKWIEAVTARFFKRTSNQARVYYVLDFMLFAGFVLILESGLVISTWLNLPIDNYALLVDLHIWVSILTLLLLVIKIGLHWRWIVSTTRQIFSPPQKTSRPNWGTPQPAQANRQISRREFLSMMGIVSVASVVAVSNALSSKKYALADELTQDPEVDSIAPQDIADGNAKATISNTPDQSTEVLDTNTSVTQETAVDPPASTASPTPEPVTETSNLDAPTLENTATEAAPAETSNDNCVVRCRKGCTYPGRCRKYVDNNQNNICDLTECI